MAQYRARKTDKISRGGEIQLAMRTMEWQDLPVMSGTILLGRLFALHDITQARTLEKLREDMTHTMVHDLRNPLMAVGYSLDLLRESRDDFSPMVTQMIVTADRSAQRMLKLVNNILDISQLESGQMPFAPQPFSLADLIQDECATQTSLATQREIKLTHTLPASLPPAWADPDLIQRVLQNLIDNALKFTPEGGEVSVTAEQITRAGKPILRIEVADSGPGIPPELRERLFTKFTTGSQDKTGNGLGLAYCKSALTAHGQKIWIADNPQGGAVFAFTLATTDL
jgi:signal transduction histidine kinase